MSIKTELLAELAAHPGECLSGEALGERLHCTRAAVWKGIRALREEGYTILAGTNRGYVLTDLSSRLNADGIRSRLKKRDVPVTVLEVTASTNRAAKQAALSDGAPHGTVIAALCQTEGAGRRGRRFYSPAESGIYFSVVLRPEKGVQDSLLLTTAAAVAVYRAVKELFGKELSIKWMNDLYDGGKKVGGILTEAISDFETGTLEFVVVGIGLNLYEPKNGFPKELEGRAAAILERGQEADRNLLIASAVNALLEEACRDEISPVYRQQNIVPGHRVRVVTSHRDYVADAVGILPDGRLEVRDERGKAEFLAFGDVSILFDS